MANIQSIKVPVEVQVDIQNSVKKFEQLAKSYEQALKNVDPSSATAKQMNKTLNQIRSYLTNIDVSTLGSELFSEKDYQQVIGYIKKIDSAFQAMAIHSQGFTAKSLNLDITGLKELEEQINELKKARSEFLKLSTAQVASPQDLNELTTAQAGQKTGFRASATHKQNLKVLADQKAQTESALAKMEEGEAQVIRADAATALDTAQNQYDAAVKTAQEAEQRLNEAAAKIKAHEQAQKNAQAAQAFSGIAGTYTGRRKSDVITEYQNVLDAQITRGGNYKTGGKAFLRTVASWLDYSDEELDVLMQQKATDVVANLKQKLETSMQANLYTFTKRVSAMAGGYNQAEHTQDLKALKQLDLDAAKAKETEVSAEAARNVAQADYNKAWQVYNETKSLLDAVNAQIEILEKLQAEFEARTKTDYTDKINKLTQQLTEQEEALKKEGINLYERGAVSSREYRADAQTEYEAHRQQVSDNVDLKIAQEAEAARIKEESETFTNNLKTSIKHWMSAQQIINIVKDGIRQAYQDVKGLDAAMTNIAVVTDMSIDDLWGKINDYMAIAQEYGVTTQGVYEVSQLYYQQGLSTAEVMAATTETLKMARIAGMDYAEAADAMTVAIRAFKMEMSDAQHVTDVYSKVAAVTASDTEELAIAMSKTASSAESVGSSFENTTAMLAVMIETTRESAQNLGSALKSIISRYGEMKVGLTVDSEGEEIDYNKVDTALKSIGISLKDTEGQFRDFDDVIIELANQWDGLDKNTQRYIATIMAGNRQQSRFIALVDNAERLNEVMTAAEDSEDAGLLQYAKTLDSLESKLNNLSTSFQQFYMSIFNGPVVGWILEQINNILVGFNKLGNWQSLLNIAGFITAVKTLGGTMLNKLSSPLTSVYNKYKEHFAKITSLAKASGRDAAYAHAQSMNENTDAALAANDSSNSYQPRHASYQRMSRMERFHGVKPTRFSSNQWGTTKGRTSHGTIVSLVGSGIGLLGSTIGSAVAEKNKVAGAWISAAGNVGSGAATGAAFGPWGAAIGALVGALGAIPALTDALNKNNQREEELLKLQEESNEKNIARAEAKEEYTTLKGLIDKINTLDETKYDSDENYQNWVAANNQLVEAYPQFIGYIDEAGNTIADLTYSSDILKDSFLQAAEASRTYYTSKISELEKQYEITKNYIYTGKVSYDDADMLQDILAVVGLTEWSDSDQLGQALRKYGIQGNLGENLINNIDLESGSATIYKTTPELLSKRIQEENLDIYNILTKVNTGVELAENEQELFNALSVFQVINKDEDTQDYTLDDQFEQYMQIEKQLQTIYATKEAAMQSGINLVSLQSSIDDTFSSIEGYYNLVTLLGENYFKDFKDFSYEDLAYLSEETYAEIIQPFEVLYTQLQKTKQWDSFSTLYSNLTKYTQSELDTLLASFGITFDSEQYSAIYQAYQSAWVEKNYQAQLVIAKTIWGAEDILEYGAFITDKTLSEKYNLTPESTIEEKHEKYQEYLASQINQLYDAEDELFNEIFSADMELLISQDEAKLLSSFYSKQSDIIQSSYSTLAKNAAYERQQFLSILYAKLGQIDINDEDWQSQFDSIMNDSFGEADYTNWLSTDVLALQSLLISEDAGSDTWKLEVDQIFSKYGQVIDWSNETFKNLLYTNFNTKINTLTDSVLQFSDDLSDLVKRQEQGFTWEESESLLSQIDEQSWDDLFKITSTGLIVLRNFDKTISDLYQSKADELDTLSNSISTLSINLTNDTYSYTDLINNIQESEWAEGGFDDLEREVLAYQELLTTLKISFDLDENAADDIIQWVVANANASEEEFIAYLETYGIQNQRLLEFFKKQRENSLAEAAFNKYFNEKYEPSQTRRELGQDPTLEGIKDYAISEALIPLTPQLDENGQQIKNEQGKLVYEYDWDAYFSSIQGILIDTFGDVSIINPEAFVRSITGNAEGALTTFEQEWINTLNSTLLETNESAISTVQSLGEDAARGKADWASMYNGASYVKQEAQTTATYWTVKDPNTGFTYEYESKDELDKALNELGNVQAEVEMVEEVLLTDTVERITYTSAELNQTIKSHLSHLYRNGNTDENKGLLRNLLASSEKYGKAENYSELTPELQAQLDAEIDAMYIAYADGRISDIATYNDLIIKYIEGTITEAEENELKELGTVVAEAQTDIVDILNKLGTDTVAAYHAAVLRAIATGATNETVTDALEKELSMAMKTRQAWVTYQTLPEQKQWEILDSANAESEDDYFANFSSKNYDALIARQELVNAAGTYSTNILDDWYTAWVMEAPELGRAEKLSATEFYNLFTYDEKLQSWVYDTTKAVDEETSEILGTLDEELTNIENVRTALQIESDSIAIQDTLVGALGEIETVTLESLADMYEQIHGAGTFAQSGLLPKFQEVLKEAKDGNTSLLIEHLQALANSAYAMGYDVDFSELEAALEDAQISLIDRLVGFLEAGIEGTLSATEHADLKERYKLSEGFQTAQGIQLTREDQQKMFGAVYGQARVSGNLQGIEDILLDILPDGIVSENLSETINDAEEAANKLGDRTNEAASAAWDYYDALVAAQKALMLNEDAYDFTFMEQEPTDGLTANFDNFKDQIDSVTDAFKAFKSKEAIDYKDFYNMMDFINEQGQWESFRDKVGKAGLDYEQFVNSVVSNTDEWGKVDIGSVAAELGISVDAAMTAMSESMTDSLTQTAREQVKYLSGLEAMLEAMAALEGLNTKYGISFDITYKDGDKVKSFEGIQDVIDYYNKLPDDAAKKEFIIEITEKYNASSGIAQQNAAHLLEIFGTDFKITDAEWDTIKSFEKAWDAASPEMRQELQKTLGQITTEQAQWLAEYATNADGTIDFSKLWETLLDPDSIQSSFGAALQQAFAGNNTISIDGQTFEIDTTSLDGNDFVIKGNPGTYASEALLTQIDTYLKKNGIQLDRNKQQTYKFDANGQLTLQVTNFDTNIAEALKSGNWITDKDGNQSQTLTIDGQEVNFVYTVGAKNFTVTAADGETPLDKEAVKSYFAKLYGLNEEGVTVEGEGTLTVGLDFTQKEDSLAAIKTAVETITAAVETGISFTIDNAEALAAITEIQTAIDAIPTSKDLTINVKQRTIGGIIGAAASVATGIIGALTGSGKTGDGKYTGTVNDLHGSALADGNAKLLAGANLANKTLVGELGPELAVYNGEYHMLGANGAEFVKLPDDAIVFNHLQTAGILNGQMNVRGQALVNGNVSGPALAGGAAEALQAVRRAKSVWQGLINDLSAADLVGAAGGGGGGGDDTKAHIEDLEEWYNLSRKIANVEQEINNIIAERENMADGHEYLRSLRLQQELLQEQIGYQETLLNYQELQLKRQADIINTDQLWSQFIHVDETGLLQYNKGNETNGGKGALEVLQDLNEMSGKDQIAFLDKIGYKYTTTDGEELEGSDLVAKFFEELQKQIDEYDALYDTVHETNETIENLKTNIEEINQEVIDNQLGLETEIYDLIVKAWEKEIEKMEEYTDKVEEANQKYIDGLQDALDAERDLYNKNQTIEERETLQRQLALLRRSGGSASEIADLEEELDSMLKDEYFDKQQETIDNIQKVNEAQLEALQQQIQLEEDALAFQQEHGIIWNQVNDIMAGGFDSMMNFFTANDSEFFEASALAQIEKLDEWAKRVGIYDEDQAHQKHEDRAAANLWDNGAIWSDASLAGLQSVFTNMADGDKKAIKDTFLNAYANAKMEGKTDDEAKAAGVNAITSALNAEKERQARANQPNTPITPSTPPATTPTESEQKFRYVYMYGKKLDENGKEKKVTVGINTNSQNQEEIRRVIRGYKTSRGIIEWLYNERLYGFSEGGLVDYTGPAIVHGTPARPEGFLNAEQTAQIRDALAASGDSTLLNTLRSVASQLKVISGAVSSSVSNNRSIEISQGAVQVQVGTLANSYDVEDLSNDIMGRIVAIADKSTNRSVGRR